MFSYLQVFFWGGITLLCFLTSFYILYNLIDDLQSIVLAKYMSFSSGSYLLLLVGINMVLFLVPLFISLLSFKKSRKIYNSLSQ